MRKARATWAVLVAVLVAVTSWAVTYAAPVRMGPVTDDWGVVRVARGQPIVIAYWLVVAGPDASLGVDSRRGIEIAIDDKKTVAGHPVRLIGEDTGCNAEGGTTAATKLAANRQIVAAIGSSCSSEAVPGAPILCKQGIVTVSPSNTAPRLTDP
ncbi:MAG: ABC transporter substrate-binding protein, partial [Armatimonadota bacterium]|nr:ABC transporter substrate-binding protein [Armatimonadota bacterium]